MLRKGTDVIFMSLWAWAKNVRVMLYFVSMWTGICASRCSCLLKCIQQGAIMCVCLCVCLLFHYWKVAGSKGIWKVWFWTSSCWKSVWSMSAAALTCFRAQWTTDKWIPLCESMDWCVGVQWEKENKSKSQSKSVCLYVCKHTVISTYSFFVWKRCGCGVSMSFWIHLCVVFSDWITYSNPLISIILLVDSSQLTKTPMSLWTLSASQTTESGWQSGLSAQPGPGAERPTEEPMCRKPFRAPAIRLRQLFFSAALLMLR